MARNKQATERNRVKKLQQSRKRREQPASGAVRLSSGKLSGKQLRRLDEAHKLVENRQFQEAQASLERLDSEHGGSHAVILEALVHLYQTSGDHEACCEAAERLTNLQPNDPQAKIVFAQEALLSICPAIALVNYREFVARWPDHEHARRALSAIDRLLPEVESRIQQSNFPEGEELDCLLLHEQSVRLLHFAKMDEAQQRCRELLAKAPAFVPARNNLAVTCFHAGQIDAAVSVVEGTRALDSQNQFASATLAKLYFLAGRFEEAQRVADEFVATPARQADAHVAQLEALAHLGRDADIVTLASLVDAKELGSRFAFQQHFLAYAQCRLGDERSARATWKKCCRTHPHPDAADENLADLEAGTGHAPWPFSTTNWIPSAIVNQFKFEHAGQLGTPQARQMLARLTPALLDRGDPQSRQIAVSMARIEQTPEQLEALKQFTFGCRGPDQLRFYCQQFLIQLGLVDSGPHRIYSNGQWIEARSFVAEITTEPRPSSSPPWVIEALTQAVTANNAGNYEQAEAMYEQVLAAEPDNCTAAYNQCAVWASRDGTQAEARIRERIQQLHADFPDYIFARIAMAQFVLTDEDDADKAHQMVAPILDAKQLHIDEAKALFIFQTQLAIKQRNLPAATKSLALLKDICGASDPVVKQLESQLQAKSQRKSLFRSLLFRS